MDSLGVARRGETHEVPRMPNARYYVHMLRSAVLLWLAISVLGCQSGEEPLRGANPGTDPVHYSPPPPRPPREPVEAPRPERAVDLPERGDTEKEPERDLDAELKAALGVPTACLRDYTAARPMKVRISVAATVRPTGMVISPSVYGAGLSNAARECIARRAETVVLPELDEPVSKPASTIIEFNYTPEVVVEAEPGVPEPSLRNVREPLPKRPEVEASGRPVAGWPTEKWISGGFDGGRPIQEPKSRRVQGPKPKPIDGYEVDENAQEWTNPPR